MDDRVFISRRTYRRLVRELHQLETVDLPAKRREMRVALELGGGMHDNAPYEHGAYDEQVLLRRLSTLKEILEKAAIVDADSDRDEQPHLGARFTVEDLDDGAASTYLIVGAYDDVEGHDRVSYLSPIGRALAGRSRGETVVVELPRRSMRLRVKSVEKLAPEEWT